MYLLLQLFPGQRKECGYSTSSQASTVVGGNENRSGDPLIITLVYNNTLSAAWFTTPRYQQLFVQRFSRFNVLFLFKRYTAP